jgi:hypothetical protein
LGEPHVALLSDPHAAPVPPAPESDQVTPCPIMFGLLLEIEAVTLTV